MKNEILNFLTKHEIINSQKTFLVAFSGGQDSLCLIDLLDELSKEYNFKIIACHLNHNWRGDTSKKEQRSCLELCKKRGIEFHTKTLEEPIKKSEEAARHERYAFFKEVCSKTNAEDVFTGHTKTDNTETLLYRIVKGTGIYGLCAIPEERIEDDIKILRPLLFATREQTAQYCTEKGLMPCSDESNDDVKYARNHLRKNVIPLLKEINPNIDDALDNLSKVAKDYEDILSDLIDEKSLTPLIFESLSEPEKKILVHKFLIKNNIDYSTKRITEIKDFIEKSIQKTCGNTISAGTDRWIFASKDKIELISRPEKIDKIIKVKIGEENYFEPLDKTLLIEEFGGSDPNFYPTEFEPKAYIKMPENIKRLELRTRKEGDIIQPFGMNGTMKLKKYFINRGVPEHKRDETLLLASDNEILWAIGVGLSEKLKVTRKPTHILELR